MVTADQLIKYNRFYALFAHVNLGERSVYVDKKRYHKHKNKSGAVSADCEYTQEETELTNQFQGRVTINKENAQDWTVVDPLVYRPEPEEDDFANFPYIMTATYDPVRLEPDIQMGSIGVYGKQIVIRCGGGLVNYPLSLEVLLRSVKMLDTTEVPDRKYKVISPLIGWSPMEGSIDAMKGFIKSTLLGHMPPSILAEAIQETEAPKNKTEEELLAVLREVDSNTRRLFL